jgi:uncharacterized lipoprotein YbaY
MRRNKVVNLSLALIIAVNIAAPLAIRAHGKHAIAGEVVYSGLDALPWHSKVHIYIEDVTAKGHPGIVVAEQTILTEQQIPIKFSIVIPDEAFGPKNTYSICADITVVEHVSFTCEQPSHFQGASKPKYVRIRVRRGM